MMRAREKDRQKKRGEEREREREREREGGERESTFVKCLNVKTIPEKI